jgi:hypothetical protein
MNMDMVKTITGGAFLVINLTMTVLIFPRKRSIPFFISMLVLYAAAFYTSLYLIFGTVVPNDGGLPALTSLPVIILLFKAKVFHIIFAYFMQFFLTSFFVIASMTISGFFRRYGEDTVSLVFTVSLTCMIASYALFTYFGARRFFGKLFEQGRPAEWGFYSLAQFFPLPLSQ